MHTYTYICIYIYINIHTYIHTYLRIHTERGGILDTERLQHLKSISYSEGDRLSPETERQLKRLKAIEEDAKSLDLQKAANARYI
jgi:hypothetical protein